MTKQEKKGGGGESVPNIDHVAERREVVAANPCSLRIGGRGSWRGERSACLVAGAGALGGSVHTLAGLVRSGRVLTGVGRRGGSSKSSESSRTRKSGSRSAMRRAVKKEVCYLRRRACEVLSGQYSTV